MEEQLEEVQSPPARVEEENEKDQEVPAQDEAGDEARTRKKRPSKSTLKTKDAWKGTLRKVKAKPQQNLQEQQEAFDSFMSLITQAPEDGRKIKGNELPQFVENDQSVEDFGFNVDDIKLEDLDSLYAAAAQADLDKLDEEERKRREEEERLEREEKERKEKEEEEARRQEEERKREEEERRKEAERIIEAERLAKQKAEEEEERRKKEEAKKAEELRLKKEQQKAENMKKFQQMTSAPARPVGKAKESSTANRFATMKIRTHSALNMALPQRRELLKKDAVGRSSSRNLVKDLESTSISSSSTTAETGSDWENQVFTRWAEFIETAKKAKAAAAAAAAAAKPVPVTEEKKKEKKKREDDAMLIIGALKKFAPPAPKSEAEGESEAKSESEPSEPEPKKRLLDSKPDAKSDRIPYLLNMYRYRGVDVDFSDLFGDSDQFTTPGVHAWCINPQGPAIQEVDPDGRLSTSGSYVILQTVGSGDTVEHKIHTWAPTNSTKFTSVAAVYAAMLTCHLGRAHITHHVKDFEEPEFFSVFFPQEIEYTNEALPALTTHTPRVPKPVLPYALFRVPKSGFIDHVAFTTSLSTTESYVLVANTDAEASIYVWVGKQSPVAIKGKAFEFARDVRAYFQDEPKIFSVPEGQEPARFTRHLIKRKAKKDDDEAEENEEEEDEPNDLILYTVKQGATKLDLKEVDSEAPFSDDFVSSAGSSIIMDCTTDIFVFLAAGCPKSIRRGSEQCAKLFYTHYDRPEWAKVWTILQPKSKRANLHPFFAQFFARPKAPRVSVPRPITQDELKRQVTIQVENYLRKGEGVKVEKKLELPPVDANRTIEVWGTVPNSTNFRKLPPASKGQFYRQDAALVVVNNPGDDRTMPSAVVYWWQGAEANGKSFQNFYFGMYQALAKKMQAEDYPRPEVHFINEHKEPADFTELFNGNIIIHLGSRVNAQADKPRLYHLKKSSSDLYHLCEVPLQTANLHSGDQFLLVAGNGTTYLWKGSASSSELSSVAESFSKQLSENPNLVSVSEGSEPEEFWELLGNAEDRNTLTDKDFVSKYDGKVKMFSVSHESGQPEVSLIHPFWTSDLEAARVVILDAFYEIYVWKGHLISGSTENYAQLWVEAYQKAVEKERKEVNVVQVQPGQEPAEFTRHFHAWFKPEEKPDVLEVRREQLKKQYLEEYRKSVREMYFKTFGEEMP